MSRIQHNDDHIQRVLSFAGRGQASGSTYTHSNSRLITCAFAAEGYEDGMGACGWILIALSWFLVTCTFPLSICFCLKVGDGLFPIAIGNFSVQVVQEYERAVIFRLGRLIGGGAKGPGIFFVLPCIESYTKVDLRTVSFDVPPQEVLKLIHKYRP